MGKTQNTTQTVSGNLAECLSVNADYFHAMRELLEAAEEVTAEECGRCVALSLNRLCVDCAIYKFKSVMEKTKGAIR